MKIFNLLLFYPLFMSIYWIIGTLYYLFTKELWMTKSINKNIGSQGISFLVPCFNESETIRETIENINSLKLENKQIIVINDGSTDDSSSVIQQLNEKIDFIFVNLNENKGKANALNQGIEYAIYEYVMGIDADTIIDDDAPYYMIDQFNKNNNLAAVTGNPRIRNKQSILGKIQTIEYASMVGSIKRSQSIAGKINTISGVFTLFKKSAVQAVGKWDTDMITEDIAISWKFHLKNFEIMYEPRALCWMLVPESIGGLWKQRIRWAQGGQEVLIRDFRGTFKKLSPPLWFLLIEQIFSLIWIYLIVISLITSIITANFLDITYLTYQVTIIILSALILTFINIIQFTVSLIIDSRYEKINIFTIIFLSWYPTVYWIINATVAIVAFPRAIRRKKGVFATWSSSDRGNIRR